MFARIATGLALALSVASASAADEPLKVLFLGDQGHHRPADRAKQLIPVMKDRGIDITYTEDQADALKPETLAKYDALIVYANSTEITPDQDKALLDYVENGGGFVPLHCASYCFLNSPAYIDLVGAQFQRHGFGEFDTETIDADHPITKGLKPFRTADETYVHTKHNEKDRHVLQVRAEGDGQEPWTWTRTQGKGRVFYTAYGHDGRTWSQPGFQDLVERGIRWAANKGEVFDSESKPQASASPRRVAPLPADRGFDPFYTKFVDADGLLVMSSPKVSDYALLEAASLIDHMLAHRPELRPQLVKNHLRFVVMSHEERTTDVPEQRDMKPKDFWDVRARGLGASRRTPVVSCGEENLLSFPGDPYQGENILIHEFGHAIDGLSLSDLDPTFDDRLNAAYDSALSKGLWKGTYAGSNPAEYWAEGVQDWFDCNLPGDFQHNDINTRDELKTYDPPLASLCSEVFGDTPWRYLPPSSRPSDSSSHLSGFDPSSSPHFSWGSAKAKYDEVVAEKRQKRQKEAAASQR